jgi:hypothetical protein
VRWAQRMASNGEVEGPGTHARWRRGRTLSQGARGAKQTTPHGPLQRLLDGDLPPREVSSKQCKS